MEDRRTIWVKTRLHRIYRIYCGSFFCEKLNKCLSTGPGLYMTGFRPLNICQISNIPHSPLIQQQIEIG